MSRVVAIDGPAGAGKSTVARRLAEKLGLMLLDTGALYRAVALHVVEAEVALDDPDAVSAVAREAVTLLDLRPAERGALARICLRDRDVTDAIRTPEVSRAASQVSALPAVREALLDVQRRLARQTPGVVAEGRDMGTVVFADARVKFFLTASLEVRAERRYQELRGQGRDIDLATTKSDVEERDRRDTMRPVAPLKPAPDALHFDSSTRTVDSIVEEMAAIAHDRLDPA